ncbi:MAG: hypothetical protein GY816_18980 [Cytophagales bacterium]|nr:hypothetical protein [Cytophagales bacterium]
MVKVIRQITVLVSSEFVRKIQDSIDHDEEPDRFFYTVLFKGTSNN